MDFESQASRRIALFALLVATAGLLAFGVLGVARGANVRFDDVRYFFLAGKLAGIGISPYDHALFTAAALEHGLGPKIDLFAYPPHSLVLCVLLSWWPIELSRWAWTLVNLCILFGTAWAMALRYEHRADTRSDAGPSAAALWIAAIVIGNPFAAHLIWTAQTGLMVLCCLLLAWHFEKRQRWLLAGVLMGLATFKPHLSLLVLAWFLMTGSWRVVAVAIITVALLLLFALVQLGPDVVQQWLGASWAYERQFIGSLSYNTNLKSLLLGVGMTLPSNFTALMLAAALAAVAWLARCHRRRPIAAHDVQAVLLATSLFWVQGRDYDMAALAPLVPMWFWHAREQRWMRWCGAAALVLMCVPHRGMAQSGLPLLPYYRIVLLGAFWLWAVAAVVPRIAHGEDTKRSSYKSNIAKR
jgi:Glycosyltransferase family 87